MHGKDLKLVIPAAQSTTYLNTATLGPPPSPALAAAAASELEWVEAGPGRVANYVGAMAEGRHFAARIEEQFTGGVISLTENNSESLLRVLWGLPFEPGDELITTDHEHDAVVLGLSSIMRRFGVVVRVAPVAGSRDFRDEVRDLLTPRTRAVVMSHVSYQTGWELPVADIAELLQARPRCRLVVDGAQGLGNVVVNPERLGANYYVFCGHKWMMAPAGWAGLWVRQQNRDELLTRWPQKPYPVDPRVLEKGPWLEYSECGDDLEFGTRSWPRVAGWSVTWDYYEEEGFPAIAGYQRDLADQARQTLNQVPGLSVVDPPAGCGATALMTVRCRPRGPELADHLWEGHRVVVKPEPFNHGVRLAWAAFNTTEDLDALLVAVQDL